MCRPSLVITDIVAAGSWWGMGVRRGARRRGAMGRCSRSAAHSQRRASARLRLPTFGLISMQALCVISASRFNGGAAAVARRQNFGFEQAIKQRWRGGVHARGRREHRCSVIKYELLNGVFRSARCRARGTPARFFLSPGLNALPRSGSASGSTQTISYTIQSSIIMT